MIQLVAGIICLLLIIGLLRIAIPYVIGIGIIIFLCWLTYAYWQIALPCWILLGIFGFWLEKKEKEKIVQWKNAKPEPLSEAEVINKIYDLTDEVSFQDNNSDKEYIFSTIGDQNNIPYGRVNAFLNFFNSSIHSETPIYFTAIKSKDKNELREYGTLITDRGIYIAKQYDEKDNNSIYKIKEIFVPFSGLNKLEGNSKKIEISCIVEDKELHNKYEILANDTSIQLSTLQQFCERILQTTLPSVFYHRAIKFFQDDGINQTDEGLDRKYEESKKIAFIDKSSEIAAVMGSNVNFNNIYSENKNLMDGARGHGYAAEYGNITMDRLAGKDVINAAQNLDEFGRQVKHGADKIVDGNYIQTKYYKHASESIGAAFEHKQGIYIGPDGKMMAIEVPSDQYKDALSIMQKRIDSGQVPGAKAGDPAELYVRKGSFTYNQAFNIAQAGNLDSLKVDITSGVISSSFACGISAAIVFAAGIWNGQKPKDALKNSLITSAKAMGKSVMLYTLTMQLSRSQISNLFAANFLKSGIKEGQLVKAGFHGINNPIAAWSNSLAKSISESALAKTSLGEAMGLKAITGRTLISGTIIGCVVFGPDIVRALRGRISKRQLFKNSAVGGAGLAGAAIGQAIIPVPIAGAMVGAMVGSFVTKKTLDQFVEDDSVKMFQIFKEEFLDVAMLNDISKDEFDYFVNETLLHKDLAKILTNMYASGAPRDYARTRMENVFNALINKRKPITVELIDEGFASYSKELGWTA